MKNIENFNTRAAKRSDNINLVIADANENFKKLNYNVQEVAILAEDYICAHFDIDWRINVVITSSLQWLRIPEDKVGGKTYASDFIILAVDADSSKIKTAEMLVHELAHAIRWGKNAEWSKDLFCELVNEGLAVCLEAEFAKTQSKKTIFLKTILNRSDKENRKLCDQLKPHFSDSHHDYDGIFFGNEKYVRWMGYSVGYFIVQQYLRKTGKTVFEIIDVSYDEVRKMMESFKP